MHIFQKMYGKCAFSMIEKNRSIVFIDQRYRKKI